MGYLLSIIYDYLIARQLNIIPIPLTVRLQLTHADISVCTYTYTCTKHSNKTKSLLLPLQPDLVIFQIQQPGAHLVLQPDRRKALLPALSVSDFLKVICI